MLAFNREGWVTSVSPEVETDLAIQDACLRIALRPTQGPDLEVADLTKLRIQPPQGHSSSYNSDLSLTLRLFCHPAAALTLSL